MRDVCPKFSALVMGRTIEFGRVADLGGLPDLLRSKAGQEGLDRAFHNQGMPVELLDTPNAVVPMRDLIALYQRAAEIAGMRSFGLEASKRIDVAGLGPAGQYVMQARDLVEALKRFSVALPYHESGSRLDIETWRNELRVGYWNVHQERIGWRHTGDFTLCVIVGVISHYLGDDWTPKRIETCYAKGLWEQDLEDHFGAPVLCGRDRISVVIDRDTVKTSGKARATELGPRVTIDDLRRLGDTMPMTFPEIVTDTISRRLFLGTSDLEGAAATLGLGPRTLRRRLGEHSLNYRELLSRCRMRRARDLLLESDATIRKIAQEVGYASTPQFTRAFKQRFGTTPQEFRVRT